jgi:radical SAM superfamily enzyme YgiQ (UPF0313 family)
MKILFVNPHYPYDPFTLLLHPPLAYGYMANTLRAGGHEVVHADLPFVGNTAEAVIPFLDGVRPDFVGVTCAQSYLQALEVARVVKQWNPLVAVALGGPHVTFIPAEVLARHACVDYVLLFDAEDSMRALADALDARCSAAELRRIPGLAFRQDGVPQVTEPAAAISELDRYGRPDRSLFDMKRYLDYDYETVVMTARGCPSRCTFCSTTQMGRRFRWNSVPHICDEIEQVLDLGFSSIFFGDDTFSGHPQRVIDFCDELRRRRLRVRWTSNMRALDARPKVLEAMAQAGGYRVFVGFESVQGGTLRLLKKGTTPERLYKAAQLIKSFGIELHTAFIIGAPGDTHETLNATLDFIRLVDPAVATFNVMEPRPGTDVFSNPAKYGVTIPNRYWYETSDWVHSPVCSTETLTAPEIREWVSRCYEEFCSAEFRANDKLEPLADVAQHWEQPRLVEKLRVVS